MFQLGQLAGRGLSVEHRHSDGTWSRMELGPEHHDPAQHDPEAGWQHGRVFICRACEEEVRIASAPESDPEALNEGA
jgi:hypothetical protein